MEKQESNMQDAETMKAFVLQQRGAPTVEPAEVPVQRIEADELLVRVHAIGVGIHDSYFLPEDAQYPYPIGNGAAGVVVAQSASSRKTSLE